MQKRGKSESERKYFRLQATPIGSPSENGCEVVIEVGGDISYSSDDEGYEGKAESFLFRRYVTQIIMSRWYISSFLSLRCVS